MQLEATYLGGQIEPEITASGQRVLHQKRHLARQADLDRVGECRRLAKVDKVLERECEGHRLAQLNLNRLRRLLHIAVLAQRHRAVANIALGRELDAIFGSVDRDYTAASAHSLLP